MRGAPLACAAAVKGKTVTICGNLPLAALGMRGGVFVTLCCERAAQLELVGGVQETLLQLVGGVQATLLELVGGVQETLRRQGGGWESTGRRGWGDMQRT